MSPTGVHACFGRQAPSTQDWTLLLGRGRPAYVVSGFSYSFKGALRWPQDARCQTNPSSCIPQAAFVCFRDAVWVDWFPRLSRTESGFNDGVGNLIFDLVGWWKVKQKGSNARGRDEREIVWEREGEREKWVGGNLTLCYNFSHADCICLLHFTIVPDSSGIPACLTTARPTQQHQTSVKVKKREGHYSSMCHWWNWNWKTDWVFRLWQEAKLQTALNK